MHGAMDSHCVIVMNGERTTEAMDRDGFAFMPEMVSGKQKTRNMPGIDAMQSRAHEISPPGQMLPAIADRHPRLSMR